jgi:hypothetical protein
MDGHASVVIMSKLCAFAEVLWSDDVETTAIERDLDDHLELRSAGGHVRLSAAALDSLTESTLLTEVSAIDPHATSTLRTCLAATEMIAEMKTNKNTAGMTLLRHMIDAALHDHRRR